MTAELLISYDVTYAVMRHHEEIPNDVPGRSLCDMKCPKKKNKKKTDESQKIISNAIGKKNNHRTPMHTGGWSGGAIVLGKLSVPGCPTNLD